MGDSDHPLRFVADADDVWLEVVESQQRTSLDGAAITEAIDIPFPLRLGRHWVRTSRDGEVAVARADPGDADGRVTVTVHCSESTQLLSRLAWLRRVGQTAAQLEKTVAKDKLPGLLDEIHALADTAPDAASGVLVGHLAAQALYVNGRSADASVAFRDAESRWTSVGDPDRALAARAGRIEGLYQTGAYEAVLDLTRPITLLKGSFPFYFVRVQNERCLALHALARLDEAEKCYTWTMARYTDLRERVELVAALQSFASLKRDRGDLGEAQRLGEQAIHQAAGRYAPMLRGRNHLMIADIALRRGNIVQALQHLNSASGEFAVAHSARWEADTFMKLADLYSELGSYDEAYFALGQAVQRLNARDAPARLAHAMATFADLERRNGNAESAVWWARAAKETFARLDMVIEADAAEADRLSFQLAAGRIDTVAAEFPDTDQAPSENTRKWKLLFIELALRQNRLPVARAALDQLRETPLSMHGQIRLALLEAEYHERNHDTPRAQRALLDATLRVDTLARRAANPTLRYTIARQALPLRQLAARLTLEQVPAAGAVIAADLLWTWLTLDARDAPSHAGSPVSHESEKFDRAIAAELLSPSESERPSAEETAQRELLSLLAQPGQVDDAPNTAGAVSLAALRQQLDGDSAFAAYIDGDTRGALLWVTRDAVELVDAAAPGQIRSGLLALQELLRSPRSSVAEIEVAARGVSTQLFGAIPAAQAARRLYVLVDDSLNGVPWAVLTWPGTTSFLLDTTDVSLVRLDAGVGAEHLLPASLQVIVAAQQEQASALPALAGAGAEAATIRSAISAGTIQVQSPPATRTDVLSALHASRAWVHIAAHGAAQPQRIGYAGIWLEPSGAEVTPPFLSWLELLDSGVNADLVVLDACQLGDAGAAVNGNLSFADAVSRAGAAHVVAALWPVSDAAAALWVPAFYAAMTADPHHDPAQALRSAQLRLRESRAFRHPFFWAGMQTIDRFPIDSKTAH